MSLIRRLVVPLLALVGIALGMVAGEAAASASAAAPSTTTTAAAPAAPSTIVLPPGGGPLSAWHHRTFMADYEGGIAKDPCSMWLRQPIHAPDTGPVIAHAALICRYRTSSIAGVFVLQAEGQSGKSTSGPVWNGSCYHHVACWRPLVGTDQSVYALTLSYPNKPGLQLAYDSFALNEPFSTCPGASCLQQYWRVMR